MSFVKPSSQKIITRSPSSRCVSHDVASDGFLGVRVEHTSCAVDLGDDLIRDDDGDPELQDDGGV